MTNPSLPDPALLAAFINNVVTGWLLVDLAVTAAVTAALAAAWAIRRHHTSPAPRHTRHPGRHPFTVPAGARPRPAQHCSRSAAADTALLPAVAPIYLGPPIETAQHMPVVTAGGAR